jgi:hypothetical protein
MAGVPVSRPVIDWPSDALPFRAHAPNLAPTSISGGRSLAGVERIRQPDAGLWTLRLEIPIRQQPQIRLVRALAARAQGRSGVFRICVGDCGRGPGAMPGYALPPHRVPHSDGAGFSDGTAYRGETAPAALAESAVARAVSLVVQMETAVTDPEPGQFLTLRDGLHVIAEAEALGAGLHRLTVEPPLRQAAPAGSRILFDRPTGLFHLAQDNGLSLALDLQKFGQLSVDFVESVLR